MTITDFRRDLDVLSIELGALRRHGPTCNGMCGRGLSYTTTLGIISEGCPDLDVAYIARLRTVRPHPDFGPDGGPYR